MQDHDSMFTAIRHTIDWISVGAVVGALMGYLPPIAAFLAIVWYAIQIYESKTVQGWIKRSR